MTQHQKAKFKEVNLAYYNSVQAEVLRDLKARYFKDDDEAFVAFVRDNFGELFEAMFFQCLNERRVMCYLDFVRVIEAEAVKQYHM